ncbi:MAG: SGNH/GDSL hydrolase family protein [Candidatus Saccharimonadales bacterium]
MPSFGSSKTNQKAESASRIIRLAAAENGLVFVPLYEATRGKLNPLLDYAADWFHPNSRGYQVRAEAFWEKLEPRI